MWAVCAAGWTIVFLATVMINHFELFGLRQTFGHMMGRTSEHPPHFQVNGFYQYVRHAIMTGFMIAFWVTPDMTVGHLLFAMVCTAYIMVGIQFEERELIRRHGADYLDYKSEAAGLFPVSKYRPRWPGPRSAQPWATDTRPTQPGGESCSIRVSSLPLS